MSANSCGTSTLPKSYTDLGIEIPKVGSNDAPETEAPVAELAESAPAAA
jgi:hypothetical protein